jgi:gamma-glutamylcyclotransferase (GGCT)/AIG2-like uncharacterized protein YtfP
MRYSCFSDKGKIMELLFVYGTLMSSDEEMSDFLKNGARFLGKGVVKGRMYDLGEFPGIVVDQSGKIHGEVYEITRPEIWESLDRYEGAPYLYTRETVECDLGSKTVMVQVYNLVKGQEMNRPVITSGDWKRRS